MLELALQVEQVGRVWASESREIECHQQARHRHHAAPAPPRAAAYDPLLYVVRAALHGRARTSHARAARPRAARSGSLAPDKIPDTIVIL